MSKMNSKRSIAVLLLGAISAAFSMSAAAQIPYERILQAENEPESWLTYNGSYLSQRYSRLEQIDRANVDELELRWLLQNQTFGAWQSNPIVADGVMYLTERPNSIMAVDPVTGRVFWKYVHTPADNALVCCGANNRGVAVLGDRVFMGTLDARLVAVDRINGELLWKKNLGGQIVMAPITYRVDGVQYLTFISGHVLASFALPED